MAGRKLGQTRIPGTLTSPSEGRSDKMSAIFDLDDDDPVRNLIISISPTFLSAHFSSSLWQYNFKGSQSLQIPENKSNSIHGSGKRQSTLVHYTSSSSTPASMRNVKITPKAGERTPVQLTKERNRHSKSEKKQPIKSKRCKCAVHNIWCDFFSGPFYL